MARFFGKIVKKLAPELCKVLNSTLQGKKGQKSDLYTFWWGLINQVLLAYKEDIEEKLQRRIYEE